MKKSIFIITLYSIAGFAMDSFVGDDEFFSQTVGNNGEYFTDDPALKIENSREEKVQNRDFYRYEEVDSYIKPQARTVLDGVQRAFYPDGKLKYEIGYRNGRKDGMEKIFYSDGKLRSETSYRDGRKDGMEKIFYSDGKLRSETSYRNGRKDGMEKIFYSDGRLRSEIIYRNGRIERVLYKEARY